MSKLIVDVPSEQLQRIFAPSALGIPFVRGFDELSTATQYIVRVLKSGVVQVR